MITLPPPVSLKSWLSFGLEDTTLLRSMENELIKRIKLVGRSLDVGGGKGFGYVRQIEIIGKRDSINISAALEPTVVADLNDTLPIPEDAYDNVICFNTIEHVFDEHKLLAEMLRVIRPGGRLIITAPFLYRGHGTYGDYHRHTADYWESALVDQGWNTHAFVVQSLVWRPLSTPLAWLAWFMGGLRGRDVN